MSISQWFPTTIFLIKDGDISIFQVKIFSCYVKVSCETMKLIVRINFNWGLKRVFAKNERGYRLTARNNCFWSLLMLLLSVASVRRKWEKTTHIEERSVHPNSEGCNIQLWSKKKTKFQTNHLHITTNNHRLFFDVFVYYS